MFTKRPRKPDDVTAGSVFRRIRPGATIETASVLGVSPDRAGIPHVCFIVRFDPDGLAEHRTLSLSTFSDLFQSASAPDGSGLAGAP